jgi:predicted RNase H-like nuclease
VRGAALKEYEDKLDAVFCAYLAAHFWTWSYERNEMIGTREMGYIINPRLDA